MSSNEVSQVTDEITQQNTKHEEIKKSIKKGGPYSKNDKDARRDEVYRLHFDYGYSARKISELTKINRNTINGDVDYWYSQILKDVDYISPAKAMMIYLEQMEIQQTRLREWLDKVTSNPERMAIERLMYEINSKILHTFQKLADSEVRTHNKTIRWVNEFMKKNNYSQRYMTFFDTISVSKEAREKIRKIIDEDRKRVN